MLNSKTPIQRAIDLEVKDAQVIFTAVWERLEDEIGHENLRFPKELILLGGAPGAGKGTQTNFLMKSRGLTCPPVVVSELLVTPEAQKIKDQGGMVGDKEVVGILLRCAGRLPSHTCAGGMFEVAGGSDQRASHTI